MWVKKNVYITLNSITFCGYQFQFKWVSEIRNTITSNAANIVSNLDTRGVDAKDIYAPKLHQEQLHL